MADANMPAHRVCDKPTIIYSLTDPRTGEVRYVGKTIYTLAHRFSIHMSNARQGYSFHVYRWIRLLLKDGLEPIPDVIEIVPPGGDWEGAERRWIAHYRARVKLCNIVDGGGGAVGSERTAEQRKRISDALKGRKKTPEHVARATANRKWSGHTAESRARISAGVRRPEALAKIKAFRTVYRHSEDTIQKIRSAANTPEVIAKKKEARKNYKVSEQTRKKISAAKRGLKISEEHKAKIAASMKAHRAAQRAAKAAAASAQQPDML